jgi:hypothetical protein
MSETNKTLQLWNNGLLLGEVGIVSNDEETVVTINLAEIGIGTYQICYKESDSRARLVVKTLSGKPFTDFVFDGK